MLSRPPICRRQGAGQPRGAEATRAAGTAYAARPSKDPPPIQRWAAQSRRNPVAIPSQFQIATGSPSLPFDATRGSPSLPFDATRPAISTGLSSALPAVHPPVEHSVTTRGSLRSPHASPLPAHPLARCRRGHAAARAGPRALHRAARRHGPVLRVSASALRPLNAVRPSRVMRSPRTRI